MDCKNPHNRQPSKVKAEDVSAGAVPLLGSHDDQAVDESATILTVKVCIPVIFITSSPVRTNKLLALRSNDSLISSCCYRVSICIAVRVKRLVTAIARGRMVKKNISYYAVAVGAKPGIYRVGRCFADSVRP